MRSLITLILIAGTLGIPVWPNKFMQTFREEFKYNYLSGETKGTLWYNFDKRTYRLDREDGRYDRFCGSEKWLTDTPCTHYVKDEIRYLDFPELDYCCNCCDSAHGCGVLKPNWLEGAEAAGTYKDEKGREVEIWSKKGLQDNLAHFIKESGIMTKIDMKPNDTQFYSPESFKTDFDDSIFEPPHRCQKNTKCGRLSVCGFIQGNNHKAQVQSETQ